MANKRNFTNTLNSIPELLKKYIAENDELVIDFYKFLHIKIKMFNDEVKSLSVGKSYRPLIERLKHDFNDYHKAVKISKLLDTGDAIGKNAQLNLLNNRINTLWAVNNYLIDSLSNDFPNMNADFIKNANKPSIEETVYQVKNEIKELVQKLVDVLCIETEKIHKKSANDWENKLNGGKPNYSHKAIAIAYCFGKPGITTENAEEILKKHSKSTSTESLLNERTKPSELILLSENRTTNTKHYHRLLEAKKLLNEIRKSKEEAELDAIIASVEKKIDLLK